METFEEALSRAYERACGVLDWMSHSYGEPSDPRSTFKTLADDYAFVSDYLRGISHEHEDGSLDTAVLEADRMCQVIRKAAMAVVIRSFRPANRDLDRVRDRLVESFGLNGDDADLFVNLLELSLPNGQLGPAFRGKRRGVTKVLDAYDSLTRRRGQFDFSKIFAEAESKTEAASA